MTPDEFVDRYPRVWHLTEAEGWPGIERHGLLSVSALLDLYGLGGAERYAVERARRADSVPLAHPEHGRALVRDQRPMHEAVLRRTLVDMEPEEWFALLNRRVFFWVSPQRVRRHRAAALNLPRRQMLLAIDTAALLARHGDRVELSPINSGATFPLSKRPRGRDTFASLTDYPWAERHRTARREPVVELTVLRSVPDLASLVVAESVFEPFVLATDVATV